VTRAARHDATLDEALDRRPPPRLRVGLAFALAALIALLLAAYGLHAWSQAPAADQGVAPPPPRSPAGN
jgi:hypothetical protein